MIRLVWTQLIVYRVEHRKLSPKMDFWMFYARQGFLIEWIEGRICIKLDRGLLGIFKDEVHVSKVLYVILCCIRDRLLLFSSPCFNPTQVYLKPSLVKGVTNSLHHVTIMVRDRFECSLGTLLAVMQTWSSHNHLRSAKTPILRRLQAQEQA